MPSNTPEWREQNAKEQRQAMLRLGVSKGLYRVGKSAEALFETLKSAADEHATHVRDRIEEAHGGLPADLAAEIERAVVFGYVQGFAACAEEQRRKTTKAVTKSVVKKQSKAAKNKGRIITHYRKQKAAKKSARVQAVVAALGVSKASVWAAIKGIQ